MLTLVMHVGAFLFLQKLSPLQAAPASTRRPEPLRLVFAKPAADAGANEEPRLFTELPPDRADQAPERPQFLSNVTSRARDRIPGGETDLPNMQGESDVPSVKLESGERPPSPGAAEDRSREAARAANSPEARGSGEQDVGDPSMKPGTSVLERPKEPGFRGSAGSSGIDQPEMSNPGGNASLMGDISLNTTAWDYAPWLQRYSIQLRERWFPPTAYMMGMLKEGGWAVFEAEISRSGQLLRLDLLEQQGHVSLMRAAQSALRSAAPTEKLPADFPEPTLILRIRMIYPKVRTR